MPQPMSAGPNRLPWPPIIYLAVVVVGVAMQWLAPLEPWPGRAARLAVGLPLLAAGLGIPIAAGYRFNRAGTPVDPTAQATALVTGGVYRFTRNPMYLGATLLGVGLGLVGGWPWVSLAALAMPPLLTALAIRREERWLEARFGDEYCAYCARVRRWL
jgi:protein-S-isoprenylcysteine O-methyltransferase Ste14